ncbi:hypothetical protein E1211_24830 [Micromonospora sp. 15K316]|uniref:hypothetical protein n=1 Tax=Micromonospora sp. 15K316 TaxID=2530376 RepID=UPI00104A645A|nr:hypothetical protein [Micromonospora sp. 15K316]TDC30075.1 hypothetical protein E1211_24830 [Micromonospora sp. 15K316]
MIPGTTYLLGGEPVTALVAWRQQRVSERLDNGPHLTTKTTTPRNVLIRRADGSMDVRPFRGLRRPKAND